MTETRDNVVKILSESHEALRKLGCTGIMIVAQVPSPEGIYYVETLTERDKGHADMLLDHVKKVFIVK